ncbi:MAG TPA: hypothetical protein PK141_05460 [Polyangiaceae bacterium]|nr:hypothetical protein [Polyangiaceae bacterium]
MRRWLFLGGLSLIVTGGSATSTGCGELELPGTLADAGGANGRCGVGEDCVLPPPCSGPERFLYVSAKGDDKNDGCSPAKPKATIKAAVGAITKARAGFQTDGGVLPWEVHVCAGTYKESQLVVEYPLSIRGGYDCAGFKRDDGFGYAKGFKSTNETILQNGAYSPEYNSPLTFVLRRQDTKITRTDTIIDGLTIDAGEGNSGTVGVTITDGASPTLSDNKIKGGNGICSSTFGSMGVWVIDGSPLIKNNDIYGGEGKCYEPDTPENARKGRGAGNGSYGMLLQGGGDVEVVENVVNGGSGTGADATTAISVASAGKREIRNNFITWDKPRMEASGYNGGIGVAAVGDTELNIVGNVIKGGIASCFETCLIWGILAAETARIHVEGNRVYGGDAVMDPPDPETNMDRSFVFVRGIRVDHAEDALVVNNMVFSGGLYSDTVSPASMAGFNVEGKKGFYNERNATALMFDDRGHGGRAIHNTLFTVAGDPVSPPTESSQKGGKGWDVVRPFYMAIGYTGAVVQNNLALTVGGAGAGEFAFTLVEADEALGLVENNAFVNFRGPAVLMIHTNAKDGAPRPNDVYNTLEEMIAANWYKPEQIRNNVFIQADCKTIPAALCVKEASANGSFGALLPYMEGATEADFGTKRLLETGWKLTSGASCRVRGGAGAHNDAKTDLFGTARSAPVAYGAHEVDSAGCP